MKKVFLKIVLMIIFVLGIATITSNAGISASSKTVNSRR